MSRSVSIFICQNCGAETRQFFGRCTSCGEWNSIVEEKSRVSNSKSGLYATTSAKKIYQKRSEPIALLKEKSLKRLSTGYQEFDRVLGGGLVPGSLILVGGDPGIGKSTLLLQSATYMSSQSSVLYVSAEESAQQVKLRWQRLRNINTSLNLLSETNLEMVIEELYALQPEVAVIDSIQALQDQNLSSAPGSVTQVRECSAALQRVAKKANITLLIVGHVTKEGILAGPKVLEHLVDAVLTFEGDRFASHRLLRTVKNRFGATNELGIFEMQGEGLEEVSNPSKIFLSEESACGVASIVSCEGTKPLAVDIQALISQTTYPSPRRTTTGIDINRLHQILAVLEKHLGLVLSRYDCYLAVAGGLEVDEPAADLGIAAAIISSFKDCKIPKDTILIGEIGLGGQIRPVRQIPERLKEAIRLGFKQAIIPKGFKSKSLGSGKKLEIIEAINIKEALVDMLKLDIKTC